MRVASGGFCGFEPERDLGLTFAPLKKGGPNTMLRYVGLKLGLSPKWATGNGLLEASGGLWFWSNVGSGVSWGLSGGRGCLFLIWAEK